MLIAMHTVTQAIANLRRRLSDSGLSPRTVAAEAEIRPNTVRRFISTGASTAESIQAIETALNKLTGSTSVDGVGVNDGHA